MPVQQIKLELIRADDRAQPRAQLFEETVREYVEDMANGARFPPLIVFRENAKTYWLADGFHRYHAAVGHELKVVKCDVRAGGLRDAILYSCGANATHGRKRTNLDKRHAVRRLLEDKEWAHWSDREVARQCLVGHPLVAQMREEMKPAISGTSTTETRTYTTKHGTTSKQKRKKKQKQEQATEAETQQALPLQVQQDNENAFISTALWDVERLITKLNLTAEEAARRFPSHHRHTFTIAKLKELADWMVRFAAAWPEKEKTDGKEADGQKARATA